NTGIQSTPTYYRAYVICKNSGMSDTSTTLLVNSLPPCYCSSAASSTGAENIIGVNIGSWTNSSTCGSGTGNTYTDFTGVTPPKLICGSMNSCYILAGTCGCISESNGAAVFIVYNINGIFEASERVYASPTTVNGSITFSGNFLFPLSALLVISGM